MSPSTARSCSILFAACLAAACGSGSSTTDYGPTGGSNGQPTAGTNGVPPAGSGGGDAASGGTGGGFDAGSDPARNMVNAMGFCERLAQIQCAGEAHCCQNASRKHGNHDACLATQRSLCDSSIYTDSATGYDAAAAQAFLDAYEHRASQCDPGILAWGSSPEGMPNVLKGTVSQGGSCMNPLNPTEAAVARCVAGVECLAEVPSPLNYTFTCQPRSNAGGPCWTPLNCTNGYCACGSRGCDPTNPNEIGTGTCAAYKSLGSACVEPFECESLVCEGGQCVEATADRLFCFAG